MEDNFQIKSSTVAFVEEVAQKVEAVATPIVDKIEAVTEAVANKVMDAVDAVFHIGDTEVKE